ncbi:unnamed protein product, partial [Prorocentrum cordatum]
HTSERCRERGESGRRAAALAPFLRLRRPWPARTPAQVPSRTRQSLAVRSSEAETASSPSGEKAADTTAPAWPSSECRQAPSARRQMRTTPSKEAVIARLPAGQKAAEKTGPPRSLGSSSVRSHAPVAAHHRRTVRSSEESEVSTLAQSGEKAAELSA